MTFKPPITYHDSIPLYRQIAEKLEDLIRHHAFPDYRLPTERELAAIFEVSVITIKQSLNILVNKDMIYRRPRLGTFVKQATSAADNASSACQSLRWLKFFDLPDSYVGNVNRALSKRYSLSFPNTALDIQHFPNLDQLLNSQEAAVDSSDLYSMNLPWLQRQIRRKNLLDLTAFIPGADFAERYYAAALAPAQSGDAVYALPRNLDITCLFCNHTIFKEFNVPLPSTGCSWSDLAATLQCLPEQRSGQPLHRFAYFTYAARFWENFIWQLGGEIFDAEEKRCLLDHPQCVDGIVRAVRFVHSLGAGKAVDLSRDPATFFLRGHGTDLACFMGSPRLRLLINHDQADQWVTIPIPSDGLQVAGANVYYMGINNNSQLTQAALSCLDLVCGEFGQDLLGRNGTAMPAMIAAAEKHFCAAHANVCMAGFLHSTKYSLRLAPAWSYDGFRFHVLQSAIRECIQSPERCAAICRRTAEIINSV